MSFVTVEEFQVRYENTIPPADEERLATLLEDACDMAADVIGKTYDGDSGTVPGGVTSVICNAVRRAYENPTGLQGETIGDYSWRSGYTGTAGSANAGLYFTSGEQRIMRRAASRSMAGSIELEGLLPNSINTAQYLSDAASPTEPILYFDAEDLL